MEFSSTEAPRQKHHEVREQMVSQGVKKTIWLISLLLIVSMALGLWLESEIIDLAEDVLSTMGTAAIWITFLLMEVIVTPIPPDAMLLLLSKTENPKSLYGLVALFGVASTIGGTLAWALGKYVVRPERLGQRFIKFIEKHRDFTERYGRLAIALAALTPLPFSVFCWAGGFFRMTFWHLFSMSLLRIPRHLLVFYLLVSSRGWTESIKAWFS